MTLQDDALRLAELDRQVIQALKSFVEGNGEEFSHVLDEYRKLRIDLKSRMLDESAISIEDITAREILHKISRGEGLRFDKFVKWIEELSGDDLAFGEFDDADMEKLGDELFYSWYSPHSYVTALAELRPLILQCDTSPSVKHFVGQIKGCYAFQQYDAAFALCRTLLEASIRDICVRCELLPEPGEKVTLLEKYNWRCLRDKVSCGSLNEKLKGLYERLSEVLHRAKGRIGWGGSHSIPGDAFGY